MGAKCGKCGGCSSKEEVKENPDAVDVIVTREDLTKSKLNINFNTDEHLPQDWTAYKCPEDSSITNGIGVEDFKMDIFASSVASGRVCTAQPFGNEYEDAISANEAEGAPLEESYFTDVKINRSPEEYPEAPGHDQNVCNIDHKPLTCETGYLPNEAILKEMPSEDMPEKIVSGTSCEKYLLGKEEKTPPIVSVLSSVVMGFIFGVVFERSHCYEPASIRGQFIFKKWIMIKMFMGAVAGSCLVFAILSAAAPKIFAEVRATFPPPPRGFVSGGILGGALLGFGMCLAGACPGMVLPQVGTVLPNSLVTLAGGLVGALTFGVLEPFLRPMLLSKGTQCTQEDKCFLDKMLGWPFPAMCSGLGAMCAAVAILLEILVPFSDEIDTGPKDANLLAQKAWLPSLCGFLLGCLQLPCARCCNDSLGSSTAYQVISAQWLQFSSQSIRAKFNYLDNFRSGMSVWWQVFYVGIAVLGAYVSSVLSDSIPSSAGGVNVPSAFVGGFLMIFGSRLGGGCTSGHGISGMPLLHPLSILGVCAMFGSAIALAFIMDFTKTLQIKGLQGWSS